LASVSRRSWGYIARTHNKNAGTNNQRLYLNGARVAQMSDTLPLDPYSDLLSIGRHVSGSTDPSDGHIDEVRIATSQARVSLIAAEILATASSQARVSAIAVEALVSVAEVPGVPTSSHNAVIVMVLGA
jgi:Concanavalin A-like lectin/glucanases superfamily